MAVAPAATAEEEKDARQKLDAAKKALAEGKAKDAKFLLEYVLKKYPTATAAVEAKTTLETLKP
jgi:TolA-binding protein